MVVGRQGRVGRLGNSGGGRPRRDETVRCIPVCGIERRGQYRVRALDDLVPVGCLSRCLTEQAIVRGRKIRDVDNRGAAELIPGRESVRSRGIDLELPNGVDLRDRDVVVRARERPLAAPAMVGPQECEGHVLVRVRGGPGPSRGWTAPRRVDLPVHQAVAVEKELLVAPKGVERRLIVHRDGEDHSVGGAFRVRCINGAGGVRPEHAKKPARAVRRQQIGFPLGVGRLGVGP